MRKSVELGIAAVVVAMVLIAGYLIYSAILIYF